MISDHPKTFAIEQNIVPAEEVARRDSFCSSCENVILTDYYRCNICKCQITSLVNMPDKKCPAGKW